MLWDIGTKFSMAMHATATPFMFFHHPLWIEFFASISNWITPLPAKFKTELDSVYDGTMSRVFDEIKSSGGGKLSIDGATDNLAKSRSNVILHTPIPLFIEYLKYDFERRTT